MSSPILFGEPAFASGPFAASLAGILHSAPSPSGCGVDAQCSGLEPLIGNSRRSDPAVAGPGPSRRGWAPVCDPTANSRCGDA